MTTKTLDQIVPGDTVRIEWAPKTLSGRPAKTMAVQVTSCKFDHRDGGQDTWYLRGLFTPEWGDGAYPARHESMALVGDGSKVALEII